MSNCRNLFATLAACLQASQPVLALVTPQKLSPAMLTNALARLG